ncbi:hypothetical protein BXT86_00115 [candidate division WOR-3 bacterium 4484_100]|uniref:Two-component system response regulator n=1 Tax=candidate division WOR-3 bacterium 4484_100 TaxID=1936077 RepID=A0A1V4QI18_UNCW3|nr:MAG: hypothetical protein BXT86_00115 [candidate division WOR-3 bacterium 4484_100]
MNSPARAQPRIIIVEDERIVAEDIRRILEEHGYEVVGIATTKKEAIEKIEKEKPDLVLLDIILNGKPDGIDTAEYIRKYFQVPVVYLTAYAEPEFLKLAKLTQPYGYIIKPFSSKELYSNIEIALYKDKMEKRFAHLNAVLRAVRDVNKLIITQKETSGLIKGVCDRLVNTIGFENAWILLFDDKLRFISAEQSGGIKNFSDLLEQLKTGIYPPCVQKVLEASEYLLIKEATICRDCLLNHRKGDIWRIVGKLKTPDRLYGLLVLTASTDYILDKDELDLFNELCADIGYALNNIEIAQDRIKKTVMLEQSLETSRKILTQTVGALISALEKRDPYAAGHSRHVARLAKTIAIELGFSPEKTRSVHIAGLLHDIGKIYVPAQILYKPGQLTGPEYEIVKKHCQVGYDILKKVDFYWPIAKVVLQHHERIDGSGYPYGIAGDSILLEARILGVADVVEAMCSHRPYRPALGLDKALYEIKTKRGVVYDARVVDTCLRLFKEKKYQFS